MCDLKEIVILGFFALAISCSEKKSDKAQVEISGSSIVTADNSSEIDETTKEGKKLVQKFECVRCHEIKSFERPVLDKDCVRCHQAIESGVFDAEKNLIEKWKNDLHSLPHSPSLSYVGAYLRPSWLIQFLQKPHDIRPNLGANMPKLSITGSEANLIVSFLRTEVEKASGDGKSNKQYSEREIQRGESILKEKNCGSCHRFSGTSLFKPMSGDLKAKSFVLAPDLMHTRRRMTPQILRQWLKDPNAIKPDAIMPNYAFADADIEALVAVIMGTKIQTPVATLPKRLKILNRPVSFDEVDKKVFKKICWHCHSDPDFADRDGGPGNTGGFGYKGIGLSFATYEEIVSGYQGTDGNYRSIFEEKNGSSILLNSLLSRQKEEMGDKTESTLGMPLGFPSISPENIQLVETWIAQGHPE